MVSLVDSPYTFDNDAPTAVRSLGLLSEVLDTFTRTRLVQAGVPERGWCLELGAGNGSVAGWLADQVGPEGHVVALDINPRHVAAHPRLVVLGADLVTDPLPEGQFDLIHARLLLAHLPSREEIVARLVAKLAPGGVLVLEEWGSAGTGRVLSSVDPRVPALLDRYHDALLRVFATNRNDTSWAMRAHQVMRQAGLSDVDTVTHARSWVGGSAGCLLPVEVSTELADALIGQGIPADELRQLRAALTDPSTVLLGNLLWSHLGRKPR